MTARKPRQGAQSAPKTQAPAWLLPIVLLLMTLIVYRAAWHGGILWDDDHHLTSPELSSVQGLGRIWFDLGATQQYYPVVHSTFWVMHALWGDETLPYHLLNIGLHALSAFLFALILRRLGAQGAILAAVIFAVHPVHVESVAWMTELKNTLSGMLYLSAALAYLAFDRRRLSRHYALAMLLFVLAVLSKTVTVTLPAALLVVFWWQRGKLEWRRDVLPLTPFFAIGVAAGLTTAWIEVTLIGAEGADYQLTIFERCLLAGRAFWFYLSKIVWPAGLMFIYPRWTVSQSVWWQYLFPLAALGLVVALWLVRKRSRAPLAATLFFGGTLLPALGFFDVYPFQFSFVADHFQYLASLGIIAMVAAGLSWFVEKTVEKSGPSQMAMAGATLVVGLPLAIVAAVECRQYADVETLYRTTLSRNPACWLCENNLGTLAVQSSPPRLEEAEQRFQATLRLHPNYPMALNGLGVTRQQMGRLDAAVVQFQEAARLEPRFAAPYGNLGSVLIRLHRPQEAADAFQHLVTLKPADVDARNNLAGALLESGRTEDAIAELQAAQRLAPESAAVRRNLANAFAMLGDRFMNAGRPEEALAPYAEALRAEPDFAEVHNNLAAALLALGKVDEAISHLRAVVRLKPDSVAARTNLEKALERASR